MKKRITLVAALAMAIAVGGMVPASAKLGAPAVGASSCARAGGTVEVKVKDGDIDVSRNASSLVIGGDADCTGVSLLLSGITSVVLKATDDGTGTYGNVTIDLEYPEGYVANFASIPMSIQAEGVLGFDGSDLTETSYKPFVGAVTEETFALGSVTGAYYAGALHFEGGAGDDVFDASAVTTTPVVANGGDGNDTLSGGALDDTLEGGDGTNDGDDVLYGNAGDDDLHANDGTATCAKTHPVFPGEKCSGVTLTNTGVDEAWGGIGNDAITSDGGDTVAPGDGADIVTGNANQLRYSDSSTAVTVNLTTANHKVTSTAGNDVFSGTVREFVGSDLDDTFVGTDGAGEVFYGLAGADTLYGLGGADFLSGNAGNDTVKGGAANDEIYSEAGNDKVSGGNGDDTVYGGAGDDVMYGGPGNDMLRGQEGKDQGWGGRGTGDLCSAEVTDSCEYKK